jgi:beta-galactosidase
VAENSGKEQTNRVIKPHMADVQIETTIRNNSGTAKELAVKQTVLNKDGNACQMADNRIEIETEGGIILAGIDNGNPQSLNSFKSDSVELFYGKAMLIVKSKNSKGSAEIIATSVGLKGAKVTIKTK